MVKKVISWFLAIYKNVAKQISLITRLLVTFFLYIAKKMGGLVLFCFWFVLAPIDMFITIFLPKTKFHKWTNHYYHKVVRTKLTKNVSARASFTFAHGFLHLIIFILVAGCALYLFEINSTVVKNKYITIFTYSPTYNKFRGIDMTWAQTWRMEDHKELKKNFSIIFHNDTAKKQLNMKYTLSRILILNLIQQD